MSAGIDGFDVVERWAHQEALRISQSYDGRVHLVAPNPPFRNEVLFTIVDPLASGPDAEVCLHEIRTLDDPLEFTIFVRALVGPSRRKGRRPRAIHIWGVDLRYSSGRYQHATDSPWRDVDLDGSPTLQLCVDRLLSGDYYYRSLRAPWSRRRPNTYGSGGRPAR